MSKASGSIDLKSLKVAGEPNKYVTMIDGSGIRVHEAGAVNTNFVQINSSGMQVYKGGQTDAYKIAEFKSYINIGSGHSNTYTGAAAIGTNLTVSKAYQTWVGRNNVADDTVLFGVGFGETTSSKKNAFEIHSTYDTEQTVVIQANGTQTNFAMGMSVNAAKPKTAYDLYGTPLNYTVTQNTTDDTITVTISNNINTGEVIKITYMNEDDESFSDLYTATTSGTNQSVTRQGANLTVTEVVNTSVPYQLTINSYTSTNISLSSAPAAGHNISFTFTTDTNNAFIVIDANNTGYTGGMGSIKSGGGTNGKASGAYSLVFCVSEIYGSAIASGAGSSIHGYAKNQSTITASGISSSIHGSADNSTITASGAGSSIHESANNSTMIASGTSSSIHGYANSSTMIASGRSSSIHGETYSSSTLTASGISSSIHGSAFNSGTMTASGTGSSIHGEAYNSVITASGISSSIHGYAYKNSTMTAYGAGSSIHGYANNSSTMTAYGAGSSIHGYANNSSTMTAYSNGSIALNESTHALKRAQLAIGSFNEDDSTPTTTTTHPSGVTAYGTYAFIIGNGIGESTRSNALTVDWQGNVNAAGDISVQGHVSPIGDRVQVIGGSDSDITATANTWYTLAELELTAGRWVVTARARFTPSASGNHYSSICVTTTPNLEANRDRRFASGTVACQHSTCIILGLEAESTVYLRGAGSVAGTWVRDSASSLQLDAIRII